MSPLAKVEALMTLRGFGPNMSSGLVMVFGSRDFQISQPGSKRASAAIGLDVGSLQSFEEHEAVQLKMIFSAEVSTQHANRLAC